MAWKKIEDPGIAKWQPGLVLEGRVQGVRENQYGQLMDMVADDGTKTTIGIPSLLKKRLAKATAGAKLRIECVGKITLASGAMAWDFKVYEDE